jgi:hypothetical protein
MITPSEWLTAPPSAYWSPMGASIIEAHLVQLKIRQERNRLWSSMQRMQLLTDDWKDILLAKLFEIYRSERVREKLPGILSIEHNVYKRINTEVSAVYKYGATRELRSKRDEETARELWGEMHLDRRLEYANLIVNALRDVLLAPVVVNGKMQLWIIPPDRTVVIQDPNDPTQALAFWTERALVNTPGYITIQRIYADHEKWILGSTAGNDNKVVYHNLGRLPAVAVHADERIDAFWGATVGEDLVDAALSISCDLIKLSRMLQYQSELQPFFNGKPSKIAKGMGIGADTIWAGEGGWGVLNLQGDPKHLIDTINARIGWIAEQYGLAKDIYDLSASPSSGFALRAKRLPLLEARARQIKLWRDVEKELLQLTALVSQRFHPRLHLDPMAEFRTLNYHDEPGLIEPLAQNRVWRERIDMGLQSRVDAYMSAHPDVTRDEAWAEVFRVQMEEAKLNDTAVTRNAPKGLTTPQVNGAKGPPAAAANGAPAANQNDQAEVEQPAPGTAGGKKVGATDFGASGMED